MRRLPLLVAIVAAGLVAGCTHSVAGRPARPVNVVARALPTADEIGRLLGAAVEADTPPEVGGVDVLRDAKDTVTPPNCIGITHAGYRQSYQGAPVQDTGRRLWITPSANSENLSAAISIVDMRSASDAQAWYAKSVKQWQKCKGVTVTENFHRLAFLQSVDRVTVSGGVVAAKIGLTTEDGLMTPGTNWRALTATSRYLIDVEVFRIGKGAGASDPNSSVMALFVVDKIAGLR